MTKQENIFKYLGIDKWHKAGYTGKGISILSMEQVKSQSKFPYVTAINGFGDDDNGHGSRVMEQMKVIAPDAKYFTCSKKGSAEDSWKPLYLDYILKNSIPLVTTSKLSSVYQLGENREKYMQECIDNGTTFFIGAGNRKIPTGKDIYEEAKSDKYLAIGACEYDDGDVGKAFYSCEGEELDYMTIVGYNGESGTSFATNRFCAMCALVQQMFLEKCGRTLYRHELETFIKDNLKDLKTEGFDIYTGHGLFILPNPETIDVNKYIINENIYYGGFPEVRSDTIMRGIDKLHPDLQMAVNKFLEECRNQGLDVCITETLRTQAEQEKLYAQGRTTPGKIVTNCIGYQSPHCWGVAFDFCRNKKGYEYDNTDGFFDKVGKIAKTIFDNTEYDLFWGGDFRTFVDKPHVEMIKYLPDNSTKWLINNYGTPEEFMKTWEGDDKNMEEPSDWAKKAWEWACDKGRKYFDGTNPKGTVTREMLAQVLYNLFAKDEE